MSIKKIITASAESTGDEVMCVCGECRYCRAHLMSDDDEYSIEYFDDEEDEYE